LARRGIRAATRRSWFERGVARLRTLRETRDPGGDAAILV
jgi:hypothetical protein